MKTYKPLLLGLIAGLAGTATTMAMARSRQAELSTPAIAGVDLGNWPRTCRKLRRSLPQHVIYDPRPGHPFVAPAWKLRWQDTTLAIPAVAYQALTVVHQPDGSFNLVLQAESSDSSVNHGSKTRNIRRSETRSAQPQGINLQSINVVLSHTPSEPQKIEDIRVASSVFDNLDQQPVVGRRNLHRGQLLTQRLFNGPVSNDQLLELAYRHESRDLTCQLSQWETELPIAIALEHRQTATDTAVAAYPRVGEQPGRVIRHRRSVDTSANPTSNPGITEWQIQLHHSPDERAEVLVSLPEHHPSANVGLGMGQDNWWEAKDRPAWLDALEIALATGSARSSAEADNHSGADHSSVERSGAAAWETLATAIAQAEFSPASVQSVQTVAEQLNAK